MYRELFEQLVDDLRSTPWIRLEQAWIRPPVSDTQVRLAHDTLGDQLPDELLDLYAEVGGVLVLWCCQPDQCPGADVSDGPSHAGCRGKINVLGPASMAIGERGTVPVLNERRFDADELADTKRFRPIDSGLSDDVIRVGYVFDSSLDRVNPLLFLDGDSDGFSLDENLTLEQYLRGAVWARGLSGWEWGFFYPDSYEGEQLRCRRSRLFPDG